MIIHVVQPGDTLQSISEAYGVSLAALIQANGLTNSYSLVIGQSIIIVYPEITYIVKEGDTLHNIASSYNVTVLQLLQNNPFLSDRTYIFPGDVLVIKYNPT